MFLDFLYALRENGLDVSLNEWMTLMEALEKGLHGQSLTGFYRLARMIVARSEADFDRFDQTFADVFRDVPLEGEIPPEILAFLQNPSRELGRAFEEERLRSLIQDPERHDFAELLKKMHETLREQKLEEHNGGRKWVGTQGRTGYGNRGWFPDGIRVGGEGTWQTAVSVASERRYRDFRTDKVLDMRQYQLAFRRLRNFTMAESAEEKEPDIDGTVDDTAKNAGVLHVRMKNPRKNSIKLLLLMDSGGSMDVYSTLCNSLFQAATKSNYFKELHTYYFHNCIFDELFTTPQIMSRTTVDAQWVLNNYTSDYKVIIVGDAAMEPDELYGYSYNWKTGQYNPHTGMDWFRRIRRRYPACIWLNPEETPSFRSYLTRTHLDLAGLFPMYRLSVDGLEKGIKKLLSSR